MSRATAATMPRANASLREPVTVRSRIGTGWEAPTLLFITLALLAIGIVQVYSASAFLAIRENEADYYYVLKQIGGATAGLVLLSATALMDYRRLRMLAWPVLAVVIAMLGAIIIGRVFGITALTHKVNGAYRWLYIWKIGIQPSEFAKLALIIWTAALAVKKQDKLQSLSRGLMPFLLVWGIIAGLVVLQPSYSAAMLILLLAALVVFAAGARIGHFILLGIIGIPVLWKVLGAESYRLDRIGTFLDRGADAAGAGYQSTQALIAVGSGGIVGAGFGRGQQKFGFLPEPHNDFLFSMFAEEWGFIGVLVIVTLFTLFALIGFRIARDAEDMFGFLLAIGVTNLIIVQALLHFAINLGLLPTTGITLPFMSYGRSSLLVCLMGVGMLLSVARRTSARVE